MQHSFDDRFWGVEDEDNQSLGLRVQGPGERIQGTGHRVQSPGSRALNPGPRIPSPDIWTLCYGRQRTLPVEGVMM